MKASSIRAVALAVLLLARVSGAQVLTDDEAGKRHYLAGQSYYNEANYAGALREFEAAFRLSKYPAIVFQIALCQEKLDQPAAALASLEQYLTLDPDTKRRASVDELRANLRQKLAAETVAPTSTPPPRSSTGAATRAPTGRGNTARAPTTSTASGRRAPPTSTWSADRPTSPTSFCDRAS